MGRGSGGGAGGERLWGGPWGGRPSGWGGGPVGGTPPLPARMQQPMGPPAAPGKPQGGCRSSVSTGVRRAMTSLVSRQGNPGGPRGRRLLPPCAPLPATAHRNMPSKLVEPAFLGPAHFRPAHTCRHTPVTPASGQATPCTLPRARGALMHHSVSPDAPPAVSLVGAHPLSPPLFSRSGNQGPERGRRFPGVHSKLGTQPKLNAGLVSPEAERRGKGGGQ